MTLKAIICFMAATSQLWAFTVTPMLTTIDLSKARSVNLTVINDSEEELKVESKAFENVQDKDGKYSQVPTKNIITFPPLMTMPPNSTRIVRVVLAPTASTKGPSDLAPEQRYYKLIVQELPKGKSTLQETDTKTGINVKIELTTAFHIPVYVFPKGGQFNIKLLSAELLKGQVVTQVQNVGNTTVRLQEQAMEVLIGDKWLPADPKASKRVNALVTKNTVRQEWECPTCQKGNVKGFRIVGKTTRWGNFSLTKKT